MIPLIDGWETVEEMEAALGIPEGNLVATLNRYNEHAARGEDPDFHKQPEYLAPQDNGPWGAFDLSLGQAMYSGFTMGGLAITIDGEVLREDGARSPACTPRARVRRTSPRTARATPAAPNSARVRSSAGAPGHTPRGARRRRGTCVVAAVELGPFVAVRRGAGAVDDFGQLAEVLGEPGGRERADDPAGPVAGVAEGVGSAARNVKEGTGFGGHLLGAEGELVGALDDEERLVVTVVDVLRRSRDSRL